MTTRVELLGIRPVEGISPRLNDLITAEVRDALTDHPKLGVIADRLQRGDGVSTEREGGAVVVRLRAKDSENPEQPDPADRGVVLTVLTEAAVEAVA